MRHIWNRITLECYRQPGEDPMPWYAVPLTILFLVGWLSADVILTGVFS
jgi:hypothetical protein